MSGEAGKPPIATVGKCKNTISCVLLSYEELAQSIHIW